jgi:hypothetical protein
MVHDKHDKQDKHGVASDLHLRSYLTTCLYPNSMHTARWQIPNASPANIFDLTLSAIKAMPRFSGELVAIDVVGCEVTCCG